MPAFPANSVFLHICFAATSLFVGFRNTGILDPARVVEVARASHQLFTAEEEDEFTLRCPEVEPQRCPSLGELLNAEFRKWKRVISAAAAGVFALLSCFVWRFVRQEEEYGSERRRVLQELAAAGVSTCTAKRRPQLMAA